MKLPQNATFQVEPGGKWTMWFWDVDTYRRGLARLLGLTFGRHR